MWKWKNRVWMEKKSLIGVVVRVVENPHIRSYTSENQKKYYFVSWMNGGPNGRWQNLPFNSELTSYFFRNDLKYVK
tara:strand:+ start:947 stop:1174 length:228 start_codon:yes stop_codon:yes gene_type:complete